MKKNVLFGLMSILLVITSCKTKESAYKQAYEKAKAQEARAKVIEAETEIPLAMAEAFRNGNLGVMDYYKMKNIQADTQMREEIAK